MKVLITGSQGFVGRNLIQTLKRNETLEVFPYDVDSPPDRLEPYLKTADVIFHLAGVNRPQNPVEFESGNTGFTREICGILRKVKRAPKIVMSSSIQADLDNPYGVSKKLAEEELESFSRDTGAEVFIFRLPNVFGKWCRPNYNSVVATFCHNIAHDLPITINDPHRVLELVYIDDVIQAFIDSMKQAKQKPVFQYKSVSTDYRINLQQLAEKLQSFKQLRTQLKLENLKDALTQKLYATYLSYLPKTDFAYPLKINTDARGQLAEFIKSDFAGQIFISRTLPGITRGNHFHDTKTEKFLVLEGDAVIRFRNVLSDEILEYPHFRS